jgi:PKD repeat protein
MPVNTEAVDDVAPEMVIEGNTIHVVWMENKYGVENPLYYCRSLDLGKTWETPKLIAKLKDGEYARQAVSRKLSVDGNNVHIGFCDYNYSDGMSGRIFYFRSTNGGSSFETAKELIKSSKMYGCQIKAANGKVAIAYYGTGSKNGLRVLTSIDGGIVFNEKLITEEPTGLSDFWFDGSQMIVMSEYAYYYYGLNVGKVWVSVSNDNGSTFTTNKVSTTFNESPTVVREKCRCYYDGHYAPKIAKSGNNIHVVFVGYNEKIEWTTLYARSTDNGLTFEKAKDINNAILPGNGLQSALESIVAKNGHVYMIYQSTGGKIYFLQSADNGNTYSTAKSVLPDGFRYVETTWWPSLVFDPGDTNGTTVYIAGQSMFSTKSTDGGQTFNESMLVSPFMNSNLKWIQSDLVIDSKGNKHWISEMMVTGGTDHDIMYRTVSPAPAPGNTNKALSVESAIFTKFETVVVPSSPSLDFDSAMTAEAWVKFDPKSEHEVNVLAKVNGADNYDYTPNGYQLGFRKNNGKFYANSGLETDKGDFVNWGSLAIGDTLWHHIAFTYSAKSGLNNFKTYVDGLLSAQQTVTGKIITGNGLLVLGSRSSFYGTTNYKVDNIRLWNKALDQEELLQNQVKTFTGNEPGLKMFLNFDDTFKDISGHGNDAVPLYLGVLKTSDFNPPLPAFDLYQSMNQVSLTNKTQNGKTYNWSYGDGTVSDKGNPVYTYPKAGEYSITLEAMNANSKTATIKKTTVAGLDHVEPLQAGNAGYSSIAVFGGGLTADGTSLILRKSGNPDIVGGNLYSPDLGILSAQFLLDKAALGKWDIVVKKGNTEQTLKEAFQVVQAQLPAPWASISGRGAILINRWQSYTITYGNNGNVDAYGVPVYLAITDDQNVEVEFIDFEMKAPDYAIEQGIAKEVTDKGDYFVTDFVQGEPFKARVYPILIPVIPANSSASVHVRFKSPTNFKVRLLSGQPLYEIAPSSGPTKSATSFQSVHLDAAECMIAAIFQEAMDVVITAGLEDIKAKFACAYKAGSWVWETGKQIKGRKATFRNVMWNLTFVGAECGVALSPFATTTKFVLATAVSGVKNVYSFKECLKTGVFCGDMAWLIYAVGSFDPNEMIGPAGFGDNHWIQKNNVIPYTVLFENKSTATAPAHIVTITDSLDLTKFDLKEFGFGSFGFGDTILVPSGKKLRQFSMDVDLKPKMNLIARVSGQLDTISGVIKWEFLSLNPTSMQLEEDPFVGFLPPNNTSHAGEGFVSYSVGLKKELSTNAVLKNKASIVFDANSPIITNEFVNTLDLDQPQSQVYPLDATIDSRFPLAWTGSDVGSGIASYSVFVMENDTALRPWKLNTTLKSAEFIGNVGSKYKFYSVATDNVNLKEAAPAQYDASTHITVDVKEFDLKKDKLQVFPNPVKDKLNISLQNPPCGMYVVELVGINGQVCYSEIHDDFSISKGIQINVNGMHSGNYMLRLVYGNKLVTRKIVIK